jgi:hypothetical protein
MTTHLAPQHALYSYDLQRHPDGTPKVLAFADGKPYVNVYAMRSIGQSRNPVRIIARTRTVEDAQALVDALIRYTQGINQ